MKAKSAKSGSELKSYRETVVLVELDQPLCAHSYGEAPCMAALGVTGERKCFNTRRTCQDAANYSPGVLPLTFGRDQLDLTRYYGFAIPSLVTVGTTPGQINLGGMDKSAAALGQREVVSITLQDHRYSDLLVDKYRLERTLGGATPSEGEVHFDFLAGTLKAAHGAELATLAVTRTGTATRVNAAGLVELVAADVPRFDYDPATLALRGLLVEQSRTNLCLRSDELNLAPWAPVQLTGITPNAANGPTGAATLDLLVPNAVLGSHYLDNLVTVADNAICSVSAFVRGGAGYDVARLEAYAKNGSGPALNFRFSNEAMSTAQGTAQAGVQFEVEKWGGGLYRLKIHGYNALTGATPPRIRCRLVDDTINGTFSGDGVKGVYWGGAQFELGDFVTSYIPTTSAALGRGAESPVVLDISAFYNSAESSVVTEWRAGSDKTSGTLWDLNDNTASDTVRLRYVSGGTANQASVIDGAVVQANLTGAQLTTGAVYRTAFAFAENRFARSDDGAAVTTDTAGTLPTVDRLHVGNSRGFEQCNAHMRSLTYYPRALADAELVALATPGAKAPAVVPFAGVGAAAEEQGTFWGKWLARNPFHQGDALRVLEGNLGEPRAALRVRHYIVDRIEGPTDGVVTITAKDRFSLIESQRAVAPKPSEGELDEDITAAATSATLNPVGVGALYPASGHVAIGKEVCGFTRAGDVLTLTRAQLGTVAEDHKAEDLVQLVLSYITQRAHDIIYDLLVNYTTLDAALIDKPTWDARAATIPDLYTGRIAEPTPIAELIGEICEQAGLSVWHDPRSNMIELRAMRPAEASPTVTDREWILDKSLSVKRQDDRRVSEVWVYYGQRNPLASLEESQNYHSRFLDVDLDAESATQYEVPEIRRVFSRWIPQFGRGSAQRTARRLLTMFRDPPLEATFRIDASRDGELELARYFTLGTAEVQDDTGAPALVSMACVRLGRGENEISINAQGVTFGIEEDPGSPRVIYIEEDAQNLNMRDIHDSLFAPPDEISPLSVSFVIESGVYVYSDTVTLPAIKTGPWPSTVTLSLENRGFIMGRGGDGACANGIAQAAQAGGNAIELGHALTLDNTNGYVLGGGGGGGGVSISPYGYNGPNPPGLCGGGGGAGGGRGGNTNDGQFHALGGAGGLPGLPGADGANSSENGFTGYQVSCAGGGGGRVPEGTGGVGATGFHSGVASLDAKGAPCGGGGGVTVDEGDVQGGNGGDNLSNGTSGTRGGGSTESAAGGGGGWGMSGGNAVHSLEPGHTLYPGMGPGKAVALFGNVLTWAGSAPSQTSPKVRGAVS